MNAFFKKICFVFISSSFLFSRPIFAKTDIRSVANHYSDLAFSIYSDAWLLAKNFEKQVNNFLKTPTASGLENLKVLWVMAYSPYTLSEAFRFGNPIVDSLDNRINAWPLDEGFIDYVSYDYDKVGDENALYYANIIANNTVNIGNKKIDVTNITPELLIDFLKLAEESEINVVLGYHAIEFLLWGQDTNGTSAGAGNRPYTDYDVKNCTHSNCQKRGQYLQVVTQILVEDLKEAMDAWAKEGKARQELLDKSDLEIVRSIVAGMGALAYGELAGQRMRLALLLNDPEEELDCFSDNTHNSYYNNALSVKNVYLGEYTTVKANKISGPALTDLVKEIDKKLDAKFRADLEKTMKTMSELVLRANTVEKFDQMLDPNNQKGHELINRAIDSLTAQTQTLQQIMGLFGTGAINTNGD